MLCVLSTMGTPGPECLGMDQGSVYWRSKVRNARKAWRAQFTHSYK